MKKIFSLFVISILIVAGFSSTSFAATPKAGATCAKPGTRASDGKNSFSCQKKGKSGVWVLEKKSSESNSNSGNKLGGNSGNNSGPQDGSVCDAKGGKNGRSSTGVELECQKGTDGKYAWHPAMGGGGGGQSAPTTVADVFGKDKCSGTSTELTAGIIDPAKVSYFVPLGLMFSSHITPIDHIYAYFPSNRGQPIEKPAGTYQVTSPAAGKIISVEDFAKSNGYPYADYRIVIAHSCNLFSVFIHVGKLTGPAAQIASQVGASGGWGGAVAVKSGEAIADDSERPGFDYSLFDGTKKLTGFANLKSYSEAETSKPWTADILQYLPNNLRGAYEAKFLSTASPIGGKIDWDKNGTAQGNWFVEKTNGFRGLGDQGAAYDNHGKIAHGYWDTHLAIAPDAVDRNTTVFSIGDWEGCPCQFISKNSSVTGTSITSASGVVIVELTEFSFRTPAGAEVSPSEPTKGYVLYSSGNVVGLLALQVQSDGNMKVEKLPGKTDKSQFMGFSSAAKIYTH